MVTQLELDQLSREEIIARARVHGVGRPELLTRVELADEIIRLTSPSDGSSKNLRGWLGVARDLVANVVEAGLHLPDAAAVIRGEAWVDPKRVSRKPVATVTLAEIYSTQRHYDRALAMLAEVLKAEPDHEAARELRDELLKKTGKAPAEAVAPEPLAPAEPEVEPEPALPEISVDAAFFTLSEGRAQFYWELSEDSIKRARERFPEGALIARVLCLSPAPEGPVRVARDVFLGLPTGSSVAMGLERNAVVRIACGWQAGALFKPFVVAIALDDVEVQQGRAVRRFTPPAVSLEELGARELRALQALQRHTPLT